MQKLKLVPETLRKMNPPNPPLWLVVCTVFVTTSMLVGVTAWFVRMWMEVIVCK